MIPLVAFNAPMMLLMIKNYFDTIPDELLESARIDGASSFCIWLEFMVPLSGPIIANVLVLTFIYSWNDYLVPLLVMRSEKTIPLPGSPVLCVSTCKVRRMWQGFMRS